MMKNLPMKSVETPIIPMDFLPTVEFVSEVMTTLMEDTSSIPLDDVVMTSVKDLVHDEGYDSSSLISVENILVEDVDGTLTTLEEEISNLVDETGLI